MSPVAPQPYVWLATNPVDPDSDPRTDFLAWPHPDPVTLVAFTRPDPGPHPWAGGPSWPQSIPREVPPAGERGSALERPLAGDGLPWQPRKPTVAPGSLGCQGAAGPRFAQTTGKTSLSPSFKALPVNQICGENKS